MMHWCITNIRREAPNATLDVFRNYPTRYHSNRCSSTNNRSWGTKKEKTYLDAHSYGMPCCTLAEDDCSQSLSHGQFCNVTSLILRSEDISLLKHTRKKTDMPAIVAWSNKVQRKIKQAKNRKKKSSYGVSNGGSRLWLAALQWCETLLQQ